MKLSKRIFIFLIAILYVSKAHALTLQQCYNLALNQTESLQVQQEKLQELDYQLQRARRSIYPSIAFNASEFLQDTSGLSKDDKTADSFVRFEQPEIKLSARQPLFTGLREWHMSKALGYQKESAQAVLDYNRKILLQDVAETFYAVEQSKTDLANTREIINLVRARLKELQKRESIGQSRKSEILTIESQLAVLLAQEQENLGNLQNSVQLLAYWTGLKPEQIQTQDSIDRVEKLDTVESFVAKSYQRADLQALAKEAESLKRMVSYGNGAHYPQIWGSANYYLKRTGIQESVDWDALINFSLPLFEGGQISLKVKEYLSQLRQTQIQQQRLKRKIMYDINSRYVDVQTSIAKQKALEDAYQKSQESYRLQTQEYRNGLVNNLEVLESLNSLQRAKQNFDRALIATKLNLIKLKVAAEDLP